MLLPAAAQRLVELDEAKHLVQFELRQQNRRTARLSLLGGGESSDVVVAIDGKRQHVRILVVAADAAVMT